MDCLVDKYVDAGRALSDDAVKKKKKKKKSKEKKKSKKEDKSKETQDKSVKNDDNDDDEQSCWNKERLSPQVAAALVVIVGGVVGSAFALFANIAIEFHTCAPLAEIGDAYDVSQCHAAAPGTQCHVFCNKAQGYHPLNDDIKSSQYLCNANNRKESTQPHGTPHRCAKPTKTNRLWRLLPPTKAPTKAPTNGTHL